MENPNRELIQALIELNTKILESATLATQASQKLVDLADELLKTK